MLPTSFLQQTPFAYTLRQGVAASSGQQTSTYEHQEYMRRLKTQGLALEHPPKHLDARYQANQEPEPPSHFWEALAFSGELAWAGVRSVVMGQLREWGLPLPKTQTLPWEHKTLTHQTIMSRHRIPTTTDIDCYTLTLPTPKSADGVFRIPIFGDPGYHNATTLYNTRAPLQYYDDQHKQIDAAFCLGDILYPNNEKNESKASLKSGSPKSLWSNIGYVYEGFFKRHIPFLSTIGNHEIKSNQLDTFLNYIDNKQYYRVKLGSGNNGADVFFVNMNLFGNDYDQLAKREQDPRLLDAAVTEWQKMMVWLKHELADCQTHRPNSKKIVIGHYPLFPVDGTYKKEFANERLAVLGPVFAEYQVDAFVHGHVHQYSRAHPHALPSGRVSEAWLKDHHPDKLPPPSAPHKHQPKDAYAHVELGFGSTAHTELPTQFGWVTHPASLNNTTLNQTKIPPYEVPTVVLGTGFMTLEIDTKRPSKPLRNLPASVKREQTEGGVRFSFVQPPMTPTATFGGHALNTGQMSQQEAHANTFTVLDTITL